MTAQLLRSFIGREQEFETFDAALAATIGGHGGLLLVAGEAGIGKSRLLDAFARRAVVAGAMVLVGRGWDFGGAPALWPWTQILRALPEGAGRPELGAGETDERTRFGRFEALAACLVDAARERSLAILLDDLHSFDLPSIAMLRFLIGARPAQRILCVAAYRDVGSGAPIEVDEAIATLAREASIVRLRGFDRDDLAALVADVRGAAPSEALLRAVADATAGNPLFASELVRAGASERDLERAGSGELVLPRTVSDALTAHVASLPESAQRLLGVAAVVGRPSTVYFLQHVGGLKPAETRDAIAALRAARLLVPDASDATRVALTHALVREAAVARLGADERRELHRRAGEALETLYAQEPLAHLAELARHFLVVAEAGDSEKAIRYSIAAGDASSRVCAYEDAVEHYLRACALLDASGGAGSERQDELLLSLGDAQLGAGRSAAAARTFARVGEAGRAHGRSSALARAALGFARTGEYLEQVPDKLRWLEEAARTLHADDELRVRVIARLAVELQSDPLARARRDALADEAVALARASGNAASIAFALDAALHARYGSDSLAERLQLGTEIVEIGDTTARDELRLDGLRWRVSAWVERGEIARAIAENDRALQIAERRRAPGPLVNSLSRAASLAFATGRLDEGELLARRAWDIESRASSAAMGDLLYDAMLAIPRAACGRRRELEEAAPRFVATAEQLGRPFLIAYAAWMFCALGLRDPARALLRRAIGGGLSAVRDDFARLGVWTLAADVALAIDELAIATDAAQLLRPYAGRIVSIGTAAILGPVDLHLGNVAARRGDENEARRRLSSAVEQASRSGCRLWLARALLDQSRHFHDAAAAAAARALATELGLSAWLENAPPAADAPSSVRRGRLARQGAAWTLVLDGKAAQLKDARGLGHVARLLAEPGRELHALDLDGSDGAARGDAGPLLDGKAKAAYRRRLEELRELVEEAEARGDADRAEEARGEIEALSHELARAVGLGGRDRKASAAAERARMRVTTAIRRALEAIARVHPEAAAHLSRAIRTGTFLAYDPDPQGRVEWNVSS